MPEESIKRKLRQEKEKAKDLLFYEGCQITEEDNRAICLSAVIVPFFGRKIRIVLDKIETRDYEIMRSYKVLPNERREIWCRESGSKRFKKVEVRDEEIITIYDPCQ